MVMGKSRAVNMDRTNEAGFKATTLRLSGTTTSSRVLNSLLTPPPAQVSDPRPFRQNGDGIPPLHYGYSTGLTKNNAVNTSASVTAFVQPFENCRTEEESNVERFPAWSPFDEPFITIDVEQQHENVPTQLPKSSSYEILDYSNALNDTKQFPRTLLSDSLNWPNFAHCLPSVINTPPPLPTTSPSESLHRPSSSENGLPSENIPAPYDPTPLPSGVIYLPYYPIALPPGPVPGTLPFWNPYWPNYPIPPVPAYGSVYWPYYHGFGTVPSWSVGYPSVGPSQNIPPIPAPATLPCPTLQELPSSLTDLN